MRIQKVQPQSTQNPNQNKQKITFKQHLKINIDNKALTNFIDSLGITPVEKIEIFTTVKKFLTNDSEAIKGQIKLAAKNTDAYFRGMKVKQIIPDLSDKGVTISEINHTKKTFEDTINLSAKLGACSDTGSKTFNRGSFDNVTYYSILIREAVTDAINKLIPTAVKDNKGFKAHKQMQEMAKTEPEMVWKSIKAKS